VWLFFKDVCREQADLRLGSVLLTCISGSTFNPQEALRAPIKQSSPKPVTLHTQNECDERWTALHQRIDTFSWAGDCVAAQ
jgi:hypothetical protein